MIVLVPISHVARESGERVRKAMEKLKPEKVGIELGPERLEAFRRGERKVKAELSRPSLLARLLLYVQEKYAKKAGSEAGEEMRVAMEEAEKAGAELVAIDRPISITMQRFSDALSLKDLLRIVWMAVRGEEVPFDLETVPDEEMVGELVEELKDEFPKLYKVLITERDDYMAERLREMEDGVAVVGAGHVKGLVKKLEEVYVFKG